MMKDSQVRIRAFRACEDRESSQRFVDGHARVLAAHGVKKVTSSNAEWTENPGVFGIIVENKESGKVYGGARVHAAGGTQRLPIEEATGYMDEKIFRFVEKMAVNGTGELCGLWNSVEVAGLGIGSLFATRAAVAIMAPIGIDSFFALCAPYTVKWAKRVGCRVLTEVGKDGTFYYPKLDLLATAALQSDTLNLTTVNRTVERERMQSLRENPQQTAVEQPPGKPFTVQVEYDLRLPEVKHREFKNPKLPPIKIINDLHPTQ